MDSFALITDPRNYCTVSQQEYIEGFLCRIYCSICVIVLFTHYSYEQLTHIHPEVDEYKLYYAQVSICIECTYS